MTSEGQPDQQPTSAHHDQGNSMFGYDQQPPPAPYDYPPAEDQGPSTHRDTVPPAPDWVRGSAAVRSDFDARQPAPSEQIWLPPVSPSGAPPQAPPPPPVDPVPRPAAYPVPPEAVQSQPGPPPRVPIDEPPTTFTPARDAGPTRAAAAVPTANRVTPPAGEVPPSFTPQPRIYQTTAGAPQPISPAWSAESPPGSPVESPVESPAAEFTRPVSLPRPVSPLHASEQGAPLPPVSPLPTRTPGETPLPTRTPGETPLPTRNPGETALPTPDADFRPPPPARPPRPRQAPAGPPVYSDLLTPSAAQSQPMSPPPPPPPPPMSAAPPGAGPLLPPPAGAPLPPPPAGAGFAPPPAGAPLPPPPLSTRPPAPPSEATQPIWHQAPEPPAAPTEPWIPQQRIGFDPGAPPPGAPPLGEPPFGEQPFGEPQLAGSPTGSTETEEAAGKSGPSTGIIVGAVLIGATVLVALGLSVPYLLEQLRDGSGSSGSYTVGECVVQDDGDAAPSDCSAPDAYQIVSQVDSQEECDPTQPAIRVDGPPTEVYCLTPVGSATEPAPESTGE